MSRQVMFSALGVVLSTVLLVWAYTYEDESAEALGAVSARHNRAVEKLNQYRRAEADFKGKAKVWASVNREGLLKEISPHDLQKQIKHLSRTFKFTHVEIDFEELKHEHDAAQLEFHKVHLKIQSPYDRNIFQFLQQLRIRVPGIFQVEKLSLERVEKESRPFVEGNLVLTWLHREED